jgi:sugar lactone lactonase YvrE
LGGNPTLRNTYFGAAGDSFARLGRLNPSGKFRLYEDLGDYEITENPDGNAVDSNPYGILALPGKVVYTDAGGNTLNQVTAKGIISTLAVFPNRVITRPNGSMVSVQAVPTSVALGPDGDYYVGQLTGAPFTVGVANVYRVPFDGGAPVVAAGGFTNIIDIAFGPDGSLYVLEIARNAIPNFGQGGRLVRVAPDGTRTDIVTGPPLIAPGGIAVGKDGALYVTNQSISPTTGEVLRIEP